MKRWQKIVMLSVLFFVSVGTFIGLRMYFAADKESKADGGETVRMVDITKNHAWVVTERDPITLTKEEDKDLGTRDNPFVVLEIVPRPEDAQVGYMIRGAEPIDVEELVEDYATHNANNAVHQTPTLDPAQLNKVGISDTHLGYLNENYNDVAEEYVAPADAQKYKDRGWTATGTKRTQIGYLKNAEDGNGGYTIKGVTDVYSAYDSNAQGYIGNFTESVYFATFKYIGSQDTTAPRYKVSKAEKMDGWRPTNYGYELKADGSYSYKDFTGSDNSTPFYRVWFEQDDAGDYILDTAEIKGANNIYTSGEYGYGGQWANLYLHSTKEVDDSRATGYTVATDENGIYEWVLDNDADLDEVNTDVHKFLDGTKPRYYMQVEYTKYTRHQPKYYNYNKFLISMVGLGKDYGYRGTVGLDREKNDPNYWGTGGLVDTNASRERLDQVVYPKALAEAIENYYICVKTITPEELREKWKRDGESEPQEHALEWIDKADFIYFPQTARYMGNDPSFMNNYARDRRLRGTITHAASNIEAFKGQYDLSWGVIEHIMNRAIVDRMAGIYMCGNMITAASEGAGWSKANVVSKQYCIPLAKLTDYDSAPNTGYLNNFTKLGMMLLSMDQQVFVNAYWKTGLIKKDKVKRANGEWYETGSFHIQPNEDAKFYWSGYTFMPCNYNAKTKRTSRAGYDYWHPNGLSDGKTSDICKQYKLECNTWNGGGSNGIFGQVMFMNNTTSMFMATDKSLQDATGNVYLDRLDDDAVKDALDWYYNPDTGEWIGPNGETEVTDEMKKGITTTQGINHVIGKPYTPPEIGRNYRVLDIEYTNWFDEGRLKYSDSIMSESLKEDRIEKIISYLSLSAGMTVDIDFVTTDALNAMTCNLADTYDLIILGDTMEHKQYTDKNGNKVEVGVLTADYTYTTSTGDHLFYSHSGANGYSGNDITKKTLRKLTDYVNAGCAFLIWQENWRDSLLKMEEFTSNSSSILPNATNAPSSTPNPVTINKRIDTYEVDTKKVDEKSNMYMLLEFLADEAQAYDNEYWINAVTRDLIQKAANKDEDSYKEFFANRQDEIWSEIKTKGIKPTYTSAEANNAVIPDGTVNGEGGQKHVVSYNQGEQTEYEIYAGSKKSKAKHNPCVMTARNLVYLTNQYVTYKNISNASALDKATKNHYAAVVQYWYNCIVPEKPEIIFRAVPPSYTGATTSAISGMTHKYINLGSSTILKDAVDSGQDTPLDNTFKVKGVKNRTYDAKLYVDFDANGSYTDAECVASRGAIAVNAQSPGSVGSTVIQGTTTEYISDEITFRYSNFTRNATTFFASRVGGFTWKLVVRDETNKSIITEKIVTSAIKRDEKKMLRILQLVPDDMNKLVLNMQDESTAGGLKGYGGKTKSGDGWIYTYTKNLPDYYFAVTTMTVSEFESLYDTRITNNTWTTYVKLDDGTTSKYLIKDNLNLPYEPVQPKTDRLSKFDLVILGFSESDFPSLNNSKVEDGGSVVSNSYGALDNLLQYIRSGNSVIFGAGVTSVADAAKTANNPNLKIPADNPYISSASSSAVESMPGEPEEGTGSAAVPVTGGAVASIKRVYGDGYVYTKLLRGVFGMDRYGKVKSEFDGTKLNVTEGFIRDVLRMDKDPYKPANAQPEGYTYTQNMRGGVAEPFTNMGGGLKKTKQATMVNTNGQIATYPYKITNDWAYDDSIQEPSYIDSFAIAGAKAQPYQLYLDEMDRKSNGEKITEDSLANTDDVVVWSTLEADPVEAGDTGRNVYSYSPKNAANNYYLYAKGNIFYMALGEYYRDGAKGINEYTYDRYNIEDDSAQPSSLINFTPDGGSSHMERMLFINTVIAAYSKAKDLMIEVPQAYEIHANDFYYYLKTDDIDNIANYEDGDYEYILFRVSDTKSPRISVNLSFVDGTDVAYPIVASGSGVMVDSNGKLVYDTSGSKFKLKIYKYNDNSQDASKIEYDPSKRAASNIMKENSLEYKDQYPASDGKAYKLNNNQLYVIQYQKKLVNNPEKNKLVLRAANDATKSEATITIMSRGYFQLD